ncbi:macrophage erythroblast attacher isoform 1 [Moniliophthora roreri MCA 2997]|uniref:Macrophage erythroblast attacher isoform 1 n=1 Tax=Moniliophthora roreri (strain MCA 2997) TaxID=1381753 RepID=V2X6N7_MONRO|nr:macrophage erythroblast attacher isoform 1 [Moniliophthora roreri MCA 2997]
MIPSSPSHTSSGSPSSTELEGSITRSKAPASGKAPKPSRNRNSPTSRMSRMNDSARRATHNETERRRRGDLNDRFSDLAGLIPNMSGRHRRPSKFDIVNSAIAHIHASHRHRSIAAQELRLLKEEADELRREVNMWRGQAGEQLIEEPIRGEGFSMVWNQELEELPEGATLLEEVQYEAIPEGEDMEPSAIGVEEQQQVIQQAAEQGAVPDQAEQYRPLGISTALRPQTQPQDYSPPVPSSSRDPVPAHNLNPYPSHPVYNYPPHQESSNDIGWTQYPTHDVSQSQPGYFMPGWEGHSMHASESAPHSGTDLNG